MEALHEAIKVVLAQSPVVETGTVTHWNGTTQGGASGIDLQGFEEAMAVVAVGAVTGDLTVDLYDSDTDDGTAATAITDVNSVAAAFAAIDSDDDDNPYVIRIRAKDTKRYLFVRCVNADASSKAYSVTVVLGAPKTKSVSQVNTVNFEHDNNDS